MNLNFAAGMAAKKLNAAKPQPKQLPLLHPMEERAGERRRAGFGLPLSVLSPLLRRGERKKQPRAKIFAGHDNVGRQHCKRQKILADCFQFAFSLRTVLRLLCFFAANLIWRSP